MEPGNYLREKPMTGLRDYLLRKNLQNWGGPSEELLTLLADVTTTVKQTFIENSTIEVMARDSKGLIINCIKNGKTVVDGERKGGKENK